MGDGKERLAGNEFRGMGQFFRRNRLAGEQLKIGLGRHDRAAFDLWHLHAGARFPEAPCTGCGKWTCVNAQNRNLEFMRKS